MAPPSARARSTAQPAAPATHADEGQTRSVERVRDLAEVFTHRREVDAMLDLIPDAFDHVDVKFLEPACGSGNFLIGVLRRKLDLVSRAECVSDGHYEHRLLRAVCSIYGVDISASNIDEARNRMADVVNDHYWADLGDDPGALFTAAVGAILSANITCGDTIGAPESIQLCDWQPLPGGRFRRVWSPALVPVDQRDLFWSETVQDAEPVHYTALSATPAAEQRESR